MPCQIEPFHGVNQLLTVSVWINATQTNDNGHARGVPEKYVRTLFPLAGSVLFLFLCLSRGLFVRLGTLSD